MTLSARVHIFLIVTAFLVLFGTTISLASQEPEHTVIATFIHSWRKSWQSQDIKSYAGHYSKNFTYKGQGFSWWISRKKRLFSASHALTVRLSGACIKVHGRTASAEFIQRYASDTVTDIGMKKLFLHKEKGLWKITGETWKQLTREVKRKKTSKQIEILSISVVPGQKKNQTNVRFYLSHFAAPEVRTLKEQNQIILRFSNMSQWDGILSFPVGRGPIESVNTYLADGCQDFIALISLRKEGGGFSANQFYYKQEKIFEIRITEEK